MILAEHEMRTWFRLARASVLLWPLSLVAVLVCLAMTGRPYGMAIQAGSLVTMAAVGSLLGFPKLSRRWRRITACLISLVILVVLTVIWIESTIGPMWWDVLDATTGSLIAWVGLRFAVTIAVLGELPGRPAAESPR